MTTNIQRPLHFPFSFCRYFTKFRFLQRDESSRNAEDALYQMLHLIGRFIKFGHIAPGFPDTLLLPSHKNGHIPQERYGTTAYGPLISKVDEFKHLDKAAQAYPVKLPFA